MTHHRPSSDWMDDADDRALEHRLLAVAIILVTLAGAYGLTQLYATLMHGVALALR